MASNDVSKEKKRTGKNILRNQKHALEIWKTLQNAKRHQIGFILNNAKFVFTIITALLVIYFSIFSINTEVLGYIWRDVFLIFASFISLVLSIFGIYSARRDYERLLEFAAYQAKVECFLGLNEKIKVETFPEDDYLFDRFTKSCNKYSSSEKFIKGERSKRGSLLYSTEIIYCLFLIVSALLFTVAAIICLQNFLNLST